MKALIPIDSCKDCPFSTSLFDRRDKNDDYEEFIGCTKTKSYKKIYDSQYDEIPQPVKFIFDDCPYKDHVIEKQPQEESGLKEFEFEFLDYQMNCVRNGFNYILLIYKNNRIVIELSLSNALKPDKEGHHPSFELDYNIVRGEFGEFSVIIDGVSLRTSKDNYYIQTIQTAIDRWNARATLEANLE